MTLEDRLIIIKSVATRRPSIPEVRPLGPRLTPTGQFPLLRGGGNSPHAADLCDIDERRHKPVTLIALF